MCSETGFIGPHKSILLSLQSGKEVGRNLNKLIGEYLTDRNQFASPNGEISFLTPANVCASRGVIFSSCLSPHKYNDFLRRLHSLHLVVQKLLCLDMCILRLRSLRQFEED